MSKTAVNNWNSIRLKYLALIEMGQSPPSSEYTSEGNGVPFLQGCAEFGEKFPAPKVYCSEPSKLAKEGDILFSVRAPVGDLNVANQILGIGRGLCAIRPMQQLNDKFLWWTLHHVREQLRLVETGSTYAAVSTEDVANLVVPNITLFSQELIAEYLDRETAHIDALIQAKENLLTMLAEKRQALITQAVTRGLDPNVPLKPSGVNWLGDVPEHWEVKRLKQVADVRGGIAVGKNNYSKAVIAYPYLRVANVQDGTLNLNEIKTIEVPEDEAASYFLNAGDVLMNEGGDSDKLGRGAIWDGSISPCLHQNHVFAVRPFGVTSLWLNMWTNSDVAKAYFESRAKKATNLASISSSNVKELFILVPSQEEQLLIVDWIETQMKRIDDIRERTVYSIDLLKERRSALITAAVTGQIEIPQYHAHNETTNSWASVV